MQTRSDTSKIEIAALVVSALGLVVAFVALYIAYKANEISKQVARTSSDPLLVYEMESVPSNAPDKEHILEVRVRNAGLGPALILGFEAYKQGNLVSGRSPVSGHDLAASFGFANQSTSKDDLRYGQIISPNERATIFKITKWHSPLAAADFSRLVREAEFQHRLVVCYRSIYPDRYFAAVQEKARLPMSSCATSDFYKKFPPLPIPMRLQLEPPIDRSE